MKLCKNCKWIVWPLHPTTNIYAFKGKRWLLEVKEPMCNHPNALHSYVDDRPIQEAERVRRFRNQDCGPNAAWFEEQTIKEEV